MSVEQIKPFILSVWGKFSLKRHFVMLKPFTSKLVILRLHKSGVKEEIHFIKILASAKVAHSFLKRSPASSALHWPNSL